MGRKTIELKSFKVLFVYVLLFSVLATIGYAEVGCCTNPHSLLVCSNARLSDKDIDCCPDKTESPNYYYSTDNPFGPADHVECASDYFYIDTTCDSSLVSGCELGCCCKTLEQPEITEAAKCVGNEVLFYMGESDCEEICPAVAACSNGEDDDGDGCADYPEDSGCSSQSDDSEEGGGCSVFGENCNTITYKPEISNLEALPVKGERKFKITFTDECPNNAAYYEISRCKGANCDDFVLVGTTEDQIFYDPSNELLFDYDYTYLVQGSYTLQEEGETATTTGNLGDLECYQRFDYSKFCLFSTFYYKFKDYLITNLPFSENKFEDEVEQVFGDKFNAPHYCNDANELVSAGIKCTDETLCVVENNIPDCIEKPECNYDSANPLGMFVSKEQCLETKYCFYDRSFTIVDSCFSCSTDMGCIDYKSSESCSEDVCGLGTCEWRDLSTELGTGACIDKAGDNCEWCARLGSNVIETDIVTSKVLETCTREKANLLSVADYQCYFTEGIAKSCIDVMCVDYGSADCSGSTIKLDDSNRIANPSNDPCDVSVCEIFNGVCRKNADGNGQPDCQTTDEECEKDYFPPDTLLDPLIVGGVYKEINIRILDKKTSRGGESLVSGEGYVTYLSVGVTENPPFETSTEANNLLINGLSVFDTVTGEEVMALSEGENTISFYSVDLASNVGLVKRSVISASENNSRPEIFEFFVTDANEVSGSYYTTNPDPDILVTFYDDVYITEARLVNEKNAQIIYPTYDSSLQKEFLFGFDSVIPEGIYIFEVNAKDTKGRYMEETAQYRISIDSGVHGVTIIPDEGELLLENPVEVKITFEEEVELLSVEIEGEEYIEYFTSTDNVAYEGLLILEDGNLDLILKARDYAGNEFTATRRFVLDANPTLKLKIKEPSWGVAGSYTFDLIVESDNDADCKFSFSGDGSESVLEYELMDEFMETGSSEHKYDNFNRIPDGSTTEYYLHLNCIDNRYQQTTTDTLKLRVDSNPPYIENAYAYPNPVVESPPETYLNIQTNEEVVCKYSKTETEFSEMELSFPGYPDTFKDSNRVNITDLPTGGRVSYYVACRDKAEHETQTKTIDIEIDPSISLIVTDKTPDVSNSTTVKLILETNKKAQCKYSSTDSSAESGYVFGPIDYIHEKSLYLTSGTHKFYAKCKDKHLEEWSNVVEINVIIDTTEPIMKFVNDSSTLNNPEIAWMTDRLRVKWHGTDNETEVHYYSYAIEEWGSLRTVRNWTSSNKGNEWIWIDDLNLEDGVKYYFRVKAKNIVGLTSGVMESNGITIDVSAKPANCSNNAKDSGETDVDCGGECGPCDDGKKCLENYDCLNNYCVEGENVCAMPRCDDGVLNGEETDIDCGGSDCSEKCEDGLKCILDDDCESQNCESGYCKSSTCNNGELDDWESDIDCGGTCTTKCSEGMSCGSDEDCISGARCNSDGICVICAADDLDCDGVPDGSANDQDGDGIDDDWEMRYGLDPTNAADARDDNDQDGLNNLEEFREDTNPREADTDGDRYNDYVELNEYYTDPKDPDSRPSSNLWLIFLIILGGILVGGGIFIVIRQYQEKQKLEEKPASPQKIMPMPVIIPRKPAPKKNEREELEKLKQQKLEELKKKRAMEQKKKREKVFGAFGEEEKRKKPEQKKEVKEKGTKKAAAMHDKKSGALEKLSLIVGEKKKAKGENKASAFDRLSTMVGTKKERIPETDEIEEITEITEHSEDLTPKEKAELDKKKYEQITKKFPKTAEALALTLKNKNKPKRKTKVIKKKKKIKKKAKKK